MENLVAQIFGLLGMAMNISSYQAKKRRNVILMQFFGSAFFTINMFMLGAYSGFMLNGIGIIRAQIYSRESQLKRTALWNRVFVTLYVLSYAAVFLAFGKEATLKNLVLELLPTLAMVATTLSFSKSAAIIRRCALISSPCWLIYNCVSGSLGGIICEIFGLISAITGMIRYDRKSVKDKKAE